MPNAKRARPSAGLQGYVELATNLLCQARASCFAARLVGHAAAGKRRQSQETRAPTSCGKRRGCVGLSADPARGDNDMAPFSVFPGFPLGVSIRGEELIFADQDKAGTWLLRQVSFWGSLALEKDSQVRGALSQITDLMIRIGEYNVTDGVDVHYQAPPSTVGVVRSEDISKIFTENSIFTDSIPEGQAITAIKKINVGDAQNTADLLVKPQKVPANPSYGIITAIAYIALANRISEVKELGSRIIEIKERMTETKELSDLTLSNATETKRKLEAF